MQSQSAPLNAPMPEKITREVLPDGVRFTYRWFGPKHVFLLFFCIAWIGFLVFWYRQATAGIDWSGGPAAIESSRLTMLLFPLLHVGVGAGLAYYTLCGFLNRTCVDISRQEIRIRLGPLPWFGSRTVPALQVAQVYREEIVRHHKNGSSTHYQLSAVLKDNRKLKLLSGVEAADMALYLEQEIERHLGIRDQAVAGEMRK